MLLVIYLSVLTGCSSGTLTRKQREVVEHHLDLVADAIHLSVEKIHEPLKNYHQKHGNWPTSSDDQKILFGTIDPILREHHITTTKLLAVDDDEVLVEYFFDQQRLWRFPLLLESWLIVFSNKTNTASDNLEIVAIYPVWSDSQKAATELGLNAQQFTQLRNDFKSKLQDKLANYKLSLNETMNGAI